MPTRKKEDAPAYEPEREYWASFNKLVHIAGTPIPAFNKFRTNGEVLNQYADDVHEAEPI